MPTRQHLWYVLHRERVQSSPAGALDNPRRPTDAQLDHHHPQEMPRERNALHHGLLQPLPLHLGQGVQQAGGGRGEALRPLSGTAAESEIGESEELG